MDQCTYEVRAEYWRGIIQSCNQRPAGQSAKNWMEENGICEQSYYYWQRKFRQQTYKLIRKSDVVPEASEKTEVSFVEMPYSQIVQDEPAAAGHPPAAVIRTESFCIEITNAISHALLSEILKELSHA